MKFMSDWEMNVKYVVTDPKLTQAPKVAREFHDSRDAYITAHAEHMAAAAQLKAGLISWDTYGVARDKASQANKRWNEAGIDAWWSFKAGCLKEL
jgi:hypothetical protein